MPTFERSYADSMAVFDGAIDDAERDLIKRGLPLAHRPLTVHGELGVRPQLPPNLADCSWAELQNLLGVFTSWFTFANEQLQLSTGRRNVADDKKTVTWATIRRSKDGTVSDKDNATQCDARYQDALAEYEYWDVTVRILTGMVKGMEREIDTISRAVTVMELRQGVEGKGVGVGTRVVNAHLREAAKSKRDVLHAFRAGRKS